MKRRTLVLAVSFSKVMKNHKAKLGNQAILFDMIVTKIMGYWT